MKTLLIGASPKKRLSNSSYFLGISRLFMGGRANRCVKIQLPRTAAYADVFAQIHDADRVVLATPLYVDGLPSHVLRFLMALEQYCRENNVTFSMYVLANCGFYEGRQTRHLMEQVEAWCKRANVRFCGGLGIGAGEMLGFIRIMPFVYLLIALITMIVALAKQLLAHQFSAQLLLASVGWAGIARQVVLFVLFSLLAVIFLIRLALKVKHGKPLAVCYTTVLCPKFLFTVFATLYWFLRMLILHGTLPHKAFSRAEPVETPPLPS
jgi:hypothetical protein